MGSAKGHGLKVPILWGLGAFAILGLQVIPGRLEDHAFCGAWGCVPSLQTLIAQNGFWVVIAIPIVTWTIRSAPPQHLRDFSLALALAAAIFLAIAVTSEFAKWAANDPSRRPYWFQRILLTTATCTLLPLPHVAAAGLVCWRVASRRLRALRPGSTGRRSESKEK
jgi:hypothetical protein